MFLRIVLLLSGNILDRFNIVNINCRLAQKRKSFSCQLRMASNPRIRYKSWKVFTYVAASNRASCTDFFSCWGCCPRAPDLYALPPDPFFLASKYELRQIWFVSRWLDDATSDKCLGYSSLDGTNAVDESITRFVRRKMEKWPEICMGN